LNDTGKTKEPSDAPSRVDLDLIDPVIIGEGSVDDSLSIGVDGSINLGNVGGRDVHGISKDVLDIGRGVPDILNLGGMDIALNLGDADSSLDVDDDDDPLDIDDDDDDLMLEDELFGEELMEKEIDSYIDEDEE